MHSNTLKLIETEMFNQINANPVARESFVCRLLDAYANLAAWSHGDGKLFVEQIIKALEQEMLHMVGEARTSRIAIINVLRHLISLNMPGLVTFHPEGQKL